MSLSFSMHWDLKISDPKKPEVMLDTKASWYFFDDVIRFCFANRKQRYYFDYPRQLVEEMIVSDGLLKELAIKIFDEVRSSCDVAKCVRCSKWTVVSGQFCERCKQANESNVPGSVELEIEV